MVMVGPKRRWIMDQEARGLQIRLVSFSPGRTANQAIYALACDPFILIMCIIVARGADPSVHNSMSPAWTITGSFGSIPKLARHVWVSIRFWMRYFRFSNLKF